MQYKNNISLRIFILLTLIMQIASATIDYYLTYYIPISQPQSEIMDKDGVDLYKAILYTFYSEPDTAIDMITQPYIVNTLHERRDMQNYNINLGVIKGLKVELRDYGSRECRVVMDSSKIVSDYKPKELEKILRYVKKATKLNMQEHQINCLFKEIKAPLVIPPLTLPQPLNLSRVTSLTLAPYASNIQGVAFLYDTVYPLGYSDDGKIAYAIEYDTDPRDMVQIRTFIQDLVTDKILWQDEFTREGNISNVDFKSFWKERNSKILEKLDYFQMYYSNQLKFYQETLYYKHDTLFLSAKSKKSYQKDWDLEFLDSSAIYLTSKKKGQKILNEKRYKGEHVLARKPIGYISLGEQGSRRVAVVLATVHRGWEGPPHNISYEIVGANLAVGFNQ